MCARMAPWLLAMTLQLQGTLQPSSTYELSGVLFSPTRIGHSRQTFPPVAGPLPGNLGTHCSQELELGD